MQNKTLSIWTSVASQANLLSSSWSVLTVRGPQTFGGHSHLLYPAAQSHLSSGRMLKGNQGRPDPPVPHLLFRWEPPPRVLELLEVLKPNPYVLYVELEQVPEGRQVLRRGLGVGGWVLGRQGDRMGHLMMGKVKPFVHTLCNVTK